uniref:GLOBIN domain-containing protein n=1 Tax=Ascaris lumbricoides TaxID=6252 RepID=A0A0M3HNA4_ASCLU
MLLTVSEEGYPQFGILKACSSNAAERRMKFLNSSSRVAMRSLEEGVDGGVELVMRPLKDRARSLSPLKQLRTYSFRSTPSEESFLNDVVASFLRYNFLTDDNKVKIYGKMCFFKINLREGFGEMNEQQRCIRRSWCSVMQRLSRERHEFGFFVLARVFNRASYLKRAFGAEEYKSIDDIPPDHPLHRHSRIFTKLIDLTVRSLYLSLVEFVTIIVRNVDELDSEIAPAIFRYGQRHYHSNAVRKKCIFQREFFGEESVRLFCSQVVCAVVDFSDTNDAEPLCVEAWVELMRYVGAKLLDGFQFDHLANTKKLAINTNDRVFFLL